MRETGLHVVGTRGPGIVLGVAAVAVGRGAGKVAARVTALAIEPGMGSPEGKTGETGVIERGAAPRIELVALFASERQLGRPVIQDLVVQVIVQVTGGTFGAQAHVPPRRGLLVAGTAVYRSMRPKEGK